MSAKAALAALFLRLRALLEQQPCDAQHDGKRSDGESTAADHGQQSATDVLHAEQTAIHAALREIAANEKDHQASERDFWARQIRAAHGLNWITLIGAFVAILGLVAIAASLLI